MTATVSIDAEFRALIPPLREDERAQLEANIAAAGRARDKLIVWRGALLDGHNRHEICTRLGMPFETEEAAGVESRDDAKLWIVRNQLGRRNISDFVRAELALLAKPLIEAKVREKQKGGQGGVLLRENSREANEAVRTDKAIAELAGVSDNTVRKVEKIKETAAPELLQAVRAGDVSINAAADIATLSPERQAKAVEDGATLAVAKEIREQRVAESRERREAEKREAMAQPVPSGRYRTIVIDPPWEMEKIVRDNRPNPVNFGFEYPTMSEDELAAFDVAGMAADDCHLFCWTTHKHLPMALRLLERWGFKYVVCMVWHKPGGYQPFGLPQYNNEFCVYARRGSPEFIETKAFFTCFSAPRREHSRKPDEFYEVIKRVAPGPRIDVFSRELRGGFDQFGNETGKFGEAA